MKPGRELDALIAEKIFGLKRSDEGIWSKDDEEVYWPDSTHSQEDVYLPHYSTDIAAAWQVVDKITSDGFLLEIYHDGQGYKIQFGARPRVNFNSVKDMPHAICLAALETII